MFRDSYQRNLLTIFYSCGSKPLNIWDTYTQDGYITKFLDEDIRSTVLEMRGTNVSTTYMICPKGKAVLGITMPFLVMIVKNLKKYFSFEVTILDDTGTRRRFRVSNFQSTTQILPLCTVMSIGLCDGWNQIQFNLSDFCRRAYQKQFVEVQKVKINANIRVRRIYFADRILPDDKLPTEYKLFIPLTQRKGFHAKDVPKTEKEVVTPEKEKIIELMKRTSKSSLSSKVSKATSVTKIVSQVKEFEKKPVAEDGPDQRDVAAEVPVATADVAAEVPVATTDEVTEVPVATTDAEAEVPAATTDVVAEVPVATAEEPAALTEGAPDQIDTATEAPVIVDEA